MIIAVDVSSIIIVVVSSVFAFLFTGFLFFRAAAEKSSVEMFVVFGLLFVSAFYSIFSAIHLILIHLSKLL